MTLGKYKRKTFIMKSNRSLRGLCLVSLVALGACVSTGDGDLETQSESMPKVEIEALPGAHIVDADAAGMGRS